MTPHATASPSGPDAVRLRMQVDAPTDSVFKAFSENDALAEWLAESVEVSLDAGTFQFWGRHVPQGERARQRLLSATPGRQLKLAWDLDDAPSSVVDLRFEPGDGGTTLVVLDHSGLPPRGSPASSALHCFWAVSLGNLAAHCEGSPLAPPFDFTAIAQGEARVRSVVAVPIEEVYPALLDPAQVSRWCGGTAVVEPRVGGRYGFGWDHGPIALVELEPDRRIAYSWRHPGSADTLVLWELRGSRGSTFITLTHSGFTDDRRAEEFRQGWPYFLVALKRSLELGPRWQPMLG